MEDRVREYQGTEQLELFPPERDSRRAFRVALIAVVLAIGAIVFVPFAFAQEVGTGLVCNTSDQIETFIADKRDNKSRIEAINTTAGKVACAVIPVAYIREADIKTATDGTKYYKIVRIFVIAVHTGYAWQQVPPLEQYTLFPSDDTPV